LRDLKDKFDLTDLFISHDPTVVEPVSDRVAML
jgi:ABC-type glutathione transport system ATPase component